MMHNKCMGLYRNLTEVLFSLPLQIVGDGLQWYLLYFVVTSLPKG